MHFIKIMIALSLLLHPYVASSQSTDSFKIVVVVNDQIITNFEIDQRMVMLQIFGAKSMSKKEIIDFLHEIDPIAKKIGAVNTLKICDKKKNYGIQY